MSVTQCKAVINYGYQTHEVIWHISIAISITEYVLNLIQDVDPEDAIIMIMAYFEHLSASDCCLIKLESISCIKIEPQTPFLLHLNSLKKNIYI